MGYFIHGSYLMRIFNKTVLAYLSHNSWIHRGAIQIYRGVTLICRMLPYLSCVLYLFFNVVNHPVGRSSRPSDVARLSLTSTNRNSVLVTQFSFLKNKTNESLKIINNENNNNKSIFIFCLWILNS